MKQERKEEKGVKRSQEKLELEMDAGRKEQEIRKR